jgi:hypothetical protein
MECASVRHAESFSVARQLATPRRAFMEIETKLVSMMAVLQIAAVVPALQNRAALKP